MGTKRGGTATLPFALEVVRTPVQVTIIDATAQQSRPVEFELALSWAAVGPVTLHWTAGQPDSATLSEDYEPVEANRMRLATATTTGTLPVPTLDDWWVELTETFTVTITVPADTLIESAKAAAEGRIEDDGTAWARKRSLDVVLAGVGRTLATHAVDVIGERFFRPPAPQTMVGSRASPLDRDAQRGRWRQAAGVAYGVARALGVEIGSPLEGGTAPSGMFAARCGLR